LYEESTRAAREQTPRRFEDLYEPLGRWYEYRCYPADHGLAIFVSDATGRRQVEGALLESGQVLERAVAECQRAKEALRQLKEQAERTVRESAWLARIPEENPDPILRVSTDLVILYGNPAAQALYRAWGGATGQEVPAPVQEVVRAALAGNEVHRREVAWEGQALWLTIAPFPADGYATIYVHDVTERKQAVEALRESEARLRTVMEVLPVGVFLADVSGRIVSANPAAARIWSGAAAAPQSVEVYGRRKGWRVESGRWVASDEWGVVRAVRNGETCGPEEIEIQCFDGTHKTILSYATPIRDEGDRIAGAAAVHVDITARREAQRALRESEERFRRAVENASGAIVIATLDGGIRYANPAFLKLVGYDERDLQTGDLRCDRITPPEYAAVDAQAVKELRRSGVSAPHEKEYLTPEGRHVPVLISGSITGYGPEGEPQVVLFVTDLTPLKHAEQALRESEQRYRSFVQSSQGIVFQGRLDFVPIFFHGAVQPITGYTEQEFTAGRPRWDQVIHPEDLPMVLETGAPLYTIPDWATEREYRIIRKDGQIRWVHELIRNTCDDSDTPNLVQGAIYDVTERRQMEAQLQQLNEHLELQVAARTEELTRTIDRLHEEVNHRMRIEAERQKAFGELEERARQLQQLTLELSQAEDRERRRLAVILHDDLQQLLAAAKFHLGLLNRRLGHDEESTRLGTTANDLLQQAIDQSRSLSHELSPPALARGDLRDALEWLTEQMQAKHGLSVRLEAPDRWQYPSEPLKSLLFKAAQEMLFNVVKHAQVREARVRLGRRHGRIYLSVADRGRGFDPHAAGKAGFGLLSIRERLKLLGGRLKVVSTEGRGSIFVLAVPDPEEGSSHEDRQRNSSHPTVASENAGDTRSTTPPGPDARPERLQDSTRHNAVLRVLLVDDHKIVRQGIEAILAEERDIAVVGEAGNGREAVDLAERLRPDVVVMDVAMPVMAGDEATQQIKERLPQTRIVALSMFDDARVADRMRRAGAAAYLLKTAPTEELLAAIRGN
jgi:PAS domain S-box-containing protein